MEEFQELLKKDTHSRIEIRSALHADIPNVIYHYTSIQGLLGIFSSSRLWATHYKFLNDESEITYALNILKCLIETKAKNVPNEIIATFLERILQTANPFDGMFDCYVTCFCSNGDALTQWRSYTESGGGYAIGMKTRELGMRWNIEHPNQNVYLRKVTYDSEKQEELLKEVLDKTISILEYYTNGMSVSDANTYIGISCGHFRKEIAEYIISFKHPAFESEQEWRLCHIVAIHEEVGVEFRSGEYGLTPYVAIDPSPMAGVNANKLPIAEVKFGPSTNPSGTRLGLSKLLKSKSYSFVEITSTNLPVRV